MVPFLLQSEQKEKEKSYVSGPYISSCNTPIIFLLQLLIGSLLNDPTRNLIRDGNFVIIMCAAMTNAHVQEKDVHECSQSPALSLSLKRCYICLLQQTLRLIGPLRSTECLP